MYKKYINYSFILVLTSLLNSCNTIDKDSNFKRAEMTLASIYTHYGIDGKQLLRETYPYDKTNKATYLLTEEGPSHSNQYSYLWPYSGNLSAVTALYTVSGNHKFKQVLEEKVLLGLEEYYDTTRVPNAYSSYINSKPNSDRFYDDNIWIGIDFTDLYLLTEDERYLDKALTVWHFIENSMDEKLGGGIYWCEQNKNGKNTCSNAPGAVYALKLFEATKDSSFYFIGKQLYEWVNDNLQDTTDYLYYDNININGNVDKKKYAYNSGQMIQAASLLYKLSNNDVYLENAQNIASSSYNYFFQHFTDTQGTSFKLLNKGDIWFTAIMQRGYIELYQIDRNPEYINAFKTNLDYAWDNMRNEKNGLFNSDWSGETKDDSKWLLTQFAMVEMYAQISHLND